MARILIIDDNETMREGLGATVRRMGHEALLAPVGGRGAQAVRAPGGAAIDFVITDLKMEGKGGLEVVKAVAERDPDCPVMIATAFGTVETAVEAMRTGRLRLHPEAVRARGGAAQGVAGAGAAGRAARARAGRGGERGAARRRRARVPLRRDRGRHAGDARASSSTIEKVAPTDASVYIHGESGTGKELVARAIHARSKRASGPFVKVNCGALTETLLESELFGHERGAFTGAIKRKLGRFELADKGTLFLDEIGDVTPALQLKLLRVLQEREFERVGGEETIKVDVRVLSATHRDIAAEVGRRALPRGSLLPAARRALRGAAAARAQGRHPAPRRALHRQAGRRARTRPSIPRRGSPTAALARLGLYAWPGNVRELENVIEQALVFAEGTAIDVGALPASVRGGLPENALALPGGEMSLPALLEDLERQLIQRAYDKSGGVKTETARLLGIKTSALYYKLEKYGIGTIESRGDKASAAGCRGRRDAARGRSARWRWRPVTNVRAEARRGAPADRRCVAVAGGTAVAIGCATAEGARRGGGRRARAGGARQLLRARLRRPQDGLRRALRSRTP